jgi:hypothetical protein
MTHVGYHIMTSVEPGVDGFATRQVAVVAAAGLKSVGARGRSTGR